jgi:hypothetical protein
LNKHQNVLAGERECERSALVNAVGTSVFTLLLIHHAKRIFLSLF